MSTCKNCGTEMDDGGPPNPSHCGQCPPWICDDCGNMCSAQQLCPCWTSLEGMNLADLKAVFALGDMDLGSPQ